jgi:peroxiredoxin
MKKILFTLLLPIFAFSITGLKVGDKVPTIELRDTDGKTVNLKETKVIVFYRGSWCPYCIKQLESIEKDMSSDSKAKLVAISVDQLKVAKKMKDKFNFSFQIVSDPKARSLKAFNLINKLDDKLVVKYKASYKIDVEADSGETHHMVAHPAVYIVKNGVVTFADINKNYKVRTNNQDIIKALK